MVATLLRSVKAQNSFQLLLLLLLMKQFRGDEEA
jgi:hypothetical protein